MTEHKIQIEGLPAGWEPVAVRKPKQGEVFLLGSGRVWNQVLEPDDDGSYLILRRIVKKYDWSKTLGDVLVSKPTEVGWFLKHYTDSPEKVAPLWQPNIHGKCPVDPEACIVRIKRADGGEAEMLASNVCWGLGFGAATVIAWQFLRLVDNTEW